RAAESRRVVEEGLEGALFEGTPAPRVEKLLPPSKELSTDSPHLAEAVQLHDGSYRLLLTGNEDTDDAQAFALTSISPDAAKQTLIGKESAKNIRDVRLWATPAGLRVMTVKDRMVQIFDEKLKPTSKFSLPEDFKGSWGLAIHLERYHALFEHDEEVVVVDTSLKLVTQVSGKGYGRWWISESPDGKLPPIIVHGDDPLNALYL